MGNTIRLSVLLLAAALLSALTARAQAGALTPHQQLARDIFKELIEINTTHQFGSTKAAEVLAARLKAAGFADADVQVVAPPGHATKGNLVARLRGTGKARPVLFIAHLDVVEARPEDWSVEPFKLLERDGFFYGRGTMDVKSEVADLVANLIRLKREGFAPDRDIIVALTADEEAGGDANGVEWLLASRRDLIDAEFCVNTDVGGGQIQAGRRARLALQTSEKLYLSFRLEVKNAGGHSSLPRKDNAIYRLAAGLTRLEKFDFPVRLNETTRTFFARTAETEKGQTAADMKAVAAPAPDQAAAARLSAASPFYNSTLRTTCVATQLEAGHAENALPQTARATVNCRLVPDDTSENVRATLVKVLADEQVTVTPLNEVQPAPASPLVPGVVAPLERVTAEMWPGVRVVPVMDPWSSDSLALRQAGVPVYGFTGIFYDVDDIRAHGKDERIGVREFYEGVEFMYRFLKTLTSGE